MKILQLQKLNPKQIKDVETLVKECLQADGLERTIYLGNDVNYYVNLRSFFLLYDNERLVSVIAIFAPTYEEAELTAYTLPTERKKGYFKTLLKEVKAELLRFNDIRRVLFVIEPKSESGIASVKALKAEYAKSEYLLSYQFPESYDLAESKPGILKKEDKIILKELIEDNLQEAVKLSSTIFQTDEEEVFEIIRLSMTTDYMKCYGAYLGMRLCGICNISFGTEHASIFSFGISPEVQGKGFGRSLLKQVLGLIQSKNYNTVKLHVSSENKRAFKLYTSEGFTIQTQYDYYEYKIR
jgi:ribosomal protein S18 acetylase RimI-like enzyme